MHFEHEPVPVGRNVHKPDTGSQPRQDTPGQCGGSLCFGRTGGRGGANRKQRDRRKQQNKQFFHVRISFGDAQGLDPASALGNQDAHFAGIGPTEAIKGPRPGEAYRITSDRQELAAADMSCTSKVPSESFDQRISTPSGRPSPRSAGSAIHPCRAHTDSESPLSAPRVPRHRP